LVDFILYSRSYCHLCDDMLTALQEYRNAYDFNVTVVDVDSDASLVQLYDELVPVLVGKRGNQSVQLCHYFLDSDKLVEFLKGDGEP
jgi:thiol-disulfide isomerase/thioredoxin